MRGLRTIPVMIEMADEMVERCPDGLLLNYTNPMAMVPWGIWAGSRVPAANVVGVCHSVRDTHAFLARTVGVPEERGRVPHRRASTTSASSTCSGTGETGEDLYPRLRAIVEADPEGLGRRVRVEIFRRFGYFPTESSEHSAEYVPWFLHHDDQVERFRIEIDEYLRRSDENLEEWDGAASAALDAGEELEVERNDELASRVHPRARDRRRPRALRERPQRRADRRAARRRLRRGAVRGRQERRPTRRGSARSRRSASRSTGRS